MVHLLLLCSFTPGYALIVGVGTKRGLPKDNNIQCNLVSTLMVLFGTVYTAMKWTLSRVNRTNRNPY